MYKSFTRSSHEMLNDSHPMGVWFWLLGFKSHLHCSAQGSAKYLRRRTVRQAPFVVIIKGWRPLKEESGVLRVDEQCAHSVDYA